MKKEQIDIINFAKTINSILPDNARKINPHSIVKTPNTQKTLSISDKVVGNFIVEPTKTYNASSEEYRGPINPAMPIPIPDDLKDNIKRVLEQEEKIKQKKFKTSLVTHTNEETIQKPIENKKEQSVFLDMVNEPINNKDQIQILLEINNKLDKIIHIIEQRSYTSSSTTDFNINEEH